MESRNETTKTREQGIEFGDLAHQVATHTYPVTSTDLVTEFGDHEIELPAGTQTLQDMFEPLQAEQFDSPEDVRQTIFNLADQSAIGRKCYSDRTPPVLGEKTEWTPESL